MTITILADLKMMWRDFSLGVRYGTLSYVQSNESNRIESNRIRIRIRIRINILLDLNLKSEIWIDNTGNRLEAEWVRVRYGWLERFYVTFYLDHGQTMMEWWRRAKEGWFFFVFTKMNLNRMRIEWIECESNESRWIMNQKYPVEGLTFWYVLVVRPHKIGAKSTLIVYSR